MSNVGNNGTNWRPPAFPDQEARDKAEKALAEIKRHEDICSFRWAAAEKAMLDLKHAIRGQTLQMWGASSFVIFLLLGIVAWLADRAL